MEQTKITFIINGNTYNVHGKDFETLRAMPKADRQQLTALLETVRQQEQREQLAESTQHTAPSLSTVKPERMGSGDVDDLMARLILEEKRNQKPALTKQALYKWIGGITVIMILWVLIF